MNYKSNEAKCLNELAQSLDKAQEDCPLKKLAILNACYAQLEIIQQNLLYEISEITNDPETLNS